MEYIRIENDFPGLQNSAVTLGKFDGLHRGHRRLVERVLEEKQKGKTAVLFSFDTGLRMIYTCEERRHLAEQMGIDLFVDCPLSENIRHMSPQAFADTVLRDRLHASFIAVGEDYRFGYKRAGTPALLKELGSTLGFEVCIVEREMDGGKKISSSTIREELSKGHMERAKDLLGGSFFLEGTVEHGAGIGHSLLLPTINIIPPEDKLMPPGGVYMTLVHFEKTVYKGLTNVGYKPTVDGSFLGVETYLYDCDEDLYGKFCRIDFLHFQRAEQKFSGLPALREQLLKDRKNGEEYFKKEVYRNDSL